jgi:hypothetical protein
MWYEIGDNLAYEKVSHALRSAKNRGKMSQRKKPKAKEYPQTPEQGNDFQRLLANQQKILENSFP